MEHYVTRRSDTGTRTSLQPEDTSYSSTCRNSNSIKVHPASPEVISSLITTLAIISAPAKKLYDDLPIAACPQGCKVDPNSPNSIINNNKEHSTSPVGPSGSDIAHGVYNDLSQLHGNVEVHPFDAAMPPIIRMSRPPSGFSPLTVAKRSSFNSLFRSRSSDSQKHQGRNCGLPCRVSNISIQSGQNSSLASLGLSASEGGSALQQQERTLVLYSSNERTHGMDREWKRDSFGVVSGDDHTATECRSSPGVQEPPPPSPSSAAAAHINTDVMLHSPSIPSRTSSIRRSRDKITMISVYEPSAGVVGSPKMIPSRDSSLRHSLSTSPLTKKRRSQNSEQHSMDNHQETLIGVSQARSIMADKVLVDRAGDEVSKRIQELKAQKILRNQQLASEAVRPSQGPISSNSNSLPLSSPSHLDEPEITGASLDAIALGDSNTRDSQPHTKQNHNTTSLSGIENRRRSSPKYPRKYSSKVEVQNPAPIDRSQYVSKRSSTFRPKLVWRATDPESYRRTPAIPFSQAIRMSQCGESPSTADYVDEAVDDYLSAPRLSQKVPHPQTGRIISFSEVGDPHGSTIFCCVGMGLTRYLTAFYDDLALKLKLRLITPDRPGVGESEAYADGSDTPLGWSDDILAICQHLQINRFCLLAHSAGAIYALATALRMPQYIRGRIHLLAPWIPPSQMSVIGTCKDTLPMNALPYSQRLLRSLPTAFLKAANSSFFSTTSASISASLPKSPRRGHRRSLNKVGYGSVVTATPGMVSCSSQASLSPHPQINLSRRSYFKKAIPEVKDSHPRTAEKTVNLRMDKERQTDYDVRLTHAIWDLATRKANPAVDLLVCLERRQPIGFRYVDINKSVVIHHGTKDTRVPIENVQWLSTTMRKCEVRVLEGEGHGLMASAGVMGSVLMEMAKEWEDWNRVVQGKKGYQKGGPVTGS